ncbi:MAG: hypothetical protein JXA89_27690 [Anaerolineae bacterium]|nr:hypothetical protein [Anaerolineae bacterium]
MPPTFDQPLAFCEDFPAIARRFEAWWDQGMLDRPVFIASANAVPEHPISRRLDLIDHPDRWFQAKLADLQQLYRVGSSFAHFWREKRKCAILVALWQK